MLLLDAINKTPVCFLAPPAAHRFTSPCNPVYALNTKLRILFIRGKQKDRSAFSLVSPPGENCLLKGSFVTGSVIRSSCFIFRSGDQETSDGVSSNTSSHLQLLVFKFEQSEIIKQYVVSHPDPPGQQATLSHDTLEEICALYLQQRFTNFWALIEKHSVHIFFSGRSDDMKPFIFDCFLCVSVKSAVCGWKEQRLRTDMEEATGNCSDNPTKTARPRPPKLRRTSCFAEVLQTIQILLFLCVA